jgi:hypothetical protein
VIIYKWVIRIAMQEQRLSTAREGSLWLSSGDRGVVIWCPLTFSVIGS